jgi:hypothetical protein
MVFEKQSQSFDDMFFGKVKISIFSGGQIRPKIQPESGQDEFRVLRSQVGLRDCPPAIFFGKKFQAPQLFENVSKGETPKKG